MKNILITGASGLIGMRLSEILSERNYTITHLSTKLKVSGKFNSYFWDPEKGYIDQEALKQIDVIIHLAGISLYDKKWSALQKIKLLESRSVSAHLLWEYIIRLDKKPECFISASGINYYGSITQKKPFTEDDPPGTDFLAKVCQLWEAKGDLFHKSGIRTVKLRTGIVLSRKGGILKKIEKIVKCYLGSPLGSGKQYVPWVHIDDICHAYIKAIEDKTLKGAYNIVAPEIVSNLEFTKALARILHRTLFFPRVPAFILRVLYGKDFSKVLLNGSPISAQKILDKGFIFTYPKLGIALKEIYS